MLIWNGTEYADVCKLTPHSTVGPRQEMGDEYLAKLRAFLSDDKRHYYRASDRMELESYPLEMDVSSSKTRVFVYMAPHIWERLVDWVRDRIYEHEHYGAEFPPVYQQIYALTLVGGKWKDC